MSIPCTTFERHSSLNCHSNFLSLVVRTVIRDSRIRFGSEQCMWILIEQVLNCLWGALTKAFRHREKVIALKALSGEREKIAHYIKSKATPFTTCCVFFLLVLLCCVFLILVTMEKFSEGKKTPKLFIWVTEDAFKINSMLDSLDLIKTLQSKWSGLNTQNCEWELEEILDWSSRDSSTTSVVDCDPQSFIKPIMTDCLPPSLL